jgi:HPt (histidine-containing phosphotransfer) domain-containing protein
MATTHELNERDLALLSSVMDVRSTLKRLGNDIELFHEIIHIYLEDEPQLLQAAAHAIETGDATALRRAAHSLKGLAATLSAPHAVSEAFRLEQLGAAGDMSEAAESLRHLQQRLADLNGPLRQYVHES